MKHHIVLLYLMVFLLFLGGIMIGWILQNHNEHFDLHSKRLNNIEKVLYDD